jgi:type II secretory ATPase GspE/PulE/Tfp pilus assembly ATPase PilB-like protein
MLNMISKMKYKIIHNEQLKIFELLISQPTGLHILDGTLGSGIFFN